MKENLQSRPEGSGRVDEEIRIRLYRYIQVGQSTSEALNTHSMLMGD